MAPEVYRRHLLVAGIHPAALFLMQDDAEAEQQVDTEAESTSDVEPDLES